MTREEFKRLISNKIVVFFYLIIVLGILLSSVIIFKTDNTVIKSSYIDTNRESIKEEIKDNEKKLELDIYSEAQRKDLKDKNSLLDKISKEKVYEVNQNTYTNLFNSRTVLFFIILVFSITLVYYLFVEDIDENLTGLFSSTKSSLNKLFLIKGAVFSIIIATFFLFEYLLEVVNIKFNFSIYNIEFLKDSFIFTRIFEFLLFEKIVAFLMIVFLVLLIVFFYLLFRKLNFSIILTFVFILFEFISNKFIPLNSPLEAIKFVNIFSGISLDIIKYKKLFFNLFIIILIASILILFYLSKKIYKLNRPILNIEKTKGYKLKANGLFAQQLEEIFIHKKVIFILLLLVIYSVYSIFSFTISKSEKDITFEEVQNRYTGKIDDELMDKLKEDELTYKKGVERFKYLFNRLNESDDLSSEEHEELSSLSPLYYQYDSFLTVKSEIEEFHDEGIEYFLNDLGLDLLVGAKYSYSNLKLFIIACIALIVITISVVRDQFKNGINKLYYSTVGGRKKMDRNNLIILSLITITVILILYVSNFIKIFRYYPSIIKEISIEGILKSQWKISNYSLYLLMFINIYMLLLSIVKITYILTRNNSYMVVLSVMIGIMIVLFTGFYFNKFISPILLATSSFVENTGIYLIWLVLLGSFNIFSSRVIKKI